MRIFEDLSFFQIRARFVLREMVRFFKICFLLENLMMKRYRSKFYIHCTFINLNVNALTVNKGNINIFEKVGQFLLKTVKRFITQSFHAFIYISPLKTYMDCSLYSWTSNKRSEIGSSWFGAKRNWKKNYKKYKRKIVLQLMKAIKKSRFFFHSFM